MQQRWRTDPDKLTFIICLPASESTFRRRDEAGPTKDDPQARKEEDEEAEKEDAEEKDVYEDEGPEGEMIGDINLFLFPSAPSPPSSKPTSPAPVALQQQPVETKILTNQSLTLQASVEENADEDMEVIGELELMIAGRDFRRLGYGTAALLAFLRYIRRHQNDISMEYRRCSHHLTVCPSLGMDARGGSESGATTTNDGPSKAAADVDSDTSITAGAKLRYLRVKIHQSNQGSIRLFESAGFKNIHADGRVDYFGEVELRLSLS